MHADQDARTRYVSQAEFGSCDTALECLTMMIEWLKAYPSTQVDNIRVTKDGYYYSAVIDFHIKYGE